MVESKSLLLGLGGIFLLLIVLRPAFAIFWLERAVRKHKESLTSMYLALTYDDGFGKTFESRFEKKAQYFVKTHCRVRGMSERRAIKYVLRRVRGFAAKRRPRYSPGMNPFEFEACCTSVLREHGWMSWKTAPGQDQGGDVLARKGKLKVVLQCKLSRKKIGNQAVQQVTAARRYYECDIAAVVADSGYTDSAKQLASANSILLLHYSELKNLEYLIRSHFIIL